MQRLVKIVIIMAAIVTWIYYYYPSIKVTYSDIVFRTNVCRQPITYSIESIDPRFEITQLELSALISQSIVIWEEASNLDLFKEVKSDGTVKIILTFDDRQKVTNTLSGLNKEIQSETSKVDLQKMGFKELESQYKILTSEYNSGVEVYNSSINSISFDQDGAKSDLNKKRQKLDSLKNELDQYANSLNQQVSGLNNTITTFNDVGRSRGEVFHEGEYIQSAGNRSIYVYEFEDRETLVRLLTHEFGHTLGLEHVSGSASIMNEVNGSRSLKLMPEDLSELNRACAASTIP